MLPYGNVTVHWLMHPNIKAKDTDPIYPHLMPKVEHRCLMHSAGEQAGAPVAGACKHGENIPSAEGLSASEISPPATKWFGGDRSQTILLDNVFISENAEFWGPKVFRKMRLQGRWHG